MLLSVVLEHHSEITDALEDLQDVEVLLQLLSSFPPHLQEQTVSLRSLLMTPPIMAPYMFPKKRPFLLKANDNGPPLVQLQRSFLLPFAGSTMVLAVQPSTSAARAPILHTVFIFILTHIKSDLLSQLACLWLYLISLSVDEDAHTLGITGPYRI